MNKRVPMSLTALLLGAAGLTAFAAPASAGPVAPPRNYAVTFPAPATFSGITTDGAHQKVYVAANDTDAIYVVTTDGKLAGTISGLTKPSGPVLAPDGAAVYVVESGVASLARIDTATGALDRVPLPEGHCPVSLAPTGGSIWYSYRDCASGGEASLAVFDPATGQSTDAGLLLDGVRLRAMPGRPDRLVALNTAADGGMRVYDVSGTPAELARIDGVGCFDVDFVAGGDKLFAACANAPGGHRVFSTADLSEDSPLGLGTPKGVATTADGTFTAIVVPGKYGYDHVETHDVVNGRPGGVYFSAEWLGVQAGGMRFTDDGRLAAVVRRQSGSMGLFLWGAPFAHPTSITADRSAPVEYRGQITVSGTLVNGPAEAPIRIERVYRGVMEEVGRVTTAPDGTFSFTEASAGRTGQATYYFNYDGDGSHLPTSRAAGVNIGVLPFDFNGDGYPEAVAGAPYEDTGRSADSGQVTVFPGGANGISTAGVIFDQDTPEMSGSNEIDDRFGSSFASGDFNTDGYADLAVGVPGEDNDAFNNGGAVIVQFGSANGLTSRSRMLARDVADAEFGRSVAVGDFDGDGPDDLAVGAPGEGAGKVFVYRGGYYEIGTYPVAVLDQDSADVPGANAYGDRFGWSLASGDVDGDGRSDLAVGAPQDAEDKGWSTGSVTLFHGTTAQETLTGAQRVTKETEGVPGAAGPRNPATGDGADEFGLKLAMGDFNADGKDDLAVAAPGSHVKNAAGTDQADAGSVTVLYSDGAKLGTAGAAEITQLSGSVFGAPADNDFFGDTLASGDSNGDGADELAMFSYGDDRVWVTPGSASGLVLTTTTAWNQDTPGIPGSAEAGDKWGASLRFIGGAKPALMVGAPGEDAQQGAFTVVYGGPGGLTAVGATYFGEDTPGVPGTAENGDRFGTF